MMRLDLETLELVVLPGLSRSGRIASVGAEGLSAAPGRYKIASVNWFEDELAANERRALAATRLVSRCSGRGGLEPTQFLTQMARLAAQSRCAPLTLRAARSADAVFDLGESE